MHVYGGTSPFSFYFMDMFNQLFTIISNAFLGFVCPSDQRLPITQTCTVLGTSLPIKPSLITLLDNVFDRIEKCL